MTVQELANKEQETHYIVSKTELENMLTSVMECLFLNDYASETARWNAKIDVSRWKEEGGLERNIKCYPTTDNPLIPPKGYTLIATEYLNSLMEQATK